MLTKFYDAMRCHYIKLIQILNFWHNNEKHCTITQLVIKKWGLASLPFYGVTGGKNGQNSSQWFILMTFWNILWHFYSIGFPILMYDVSYYLFQFVLLGVTCKIDISLWLSDYIPTNCTFVMYLFSNHTRHCNWSISIKKPNYYEQGVIYWHIMSWNKTKAYVLEYMAALDIHFTSW